MDGGACRLTRTSSLSWWRRASRPSSGSGPTGGSGRGTRAPRRPTATPPPRSSTARSTCSRWIPTPRANGCTLRRARSSRCPAGARTAERSRCFCRCRRSARAIRLSGSPRCRWTSPRAASSSGSWSTPSASRPSGVSPRAWPTRSTIPSRSSGPRTPTSPRSRLSSTTRTSSSRRTTWSWPPNESAPSCSTCAGSRAGSGLSCWTLESARRSTSPCAW